MKQRDIKPCLGCGRGIFHDNQVMAFTVTITREILNLPAVQRQAGLEMMLGGNPLLANVMGPDEDMTKQISDPVTGPLCLDCAMSSPVAVLLEKAEAREEAKAEATHG